MNWTNMSIQETYCFNSNEKRMLYLEETLYRSKVPVPGTILIFFYIFTSLKTSSFFIW